MTGGFPSFINITWVTLIPKIQNSSSIEEFSPISMVGYLYKITSKVLVNKIKPIMGDLISENQTWFIRGRQIFDGILTANKIVNWLKKKQKEGALFKVDFSKAYDSIRWSFLDYMLKQLGFGTKTRGWLMHCVQTTSIYVFVNGSTTTPFKIQKGVIQCDPISSFLFTMVSETLTYIIQEAHRNGVVKVVKFRKDNVEITYLQFANDTLIFIPKDEEVVGNYRRILQCFGIMTRLNTNYSKSSLVNWGSNEEWVIEMSRVMKCRYEKLPIQ